ncbi:MAG: hypothetical protein ACREYC_03900 [Gammaproteobacteria bacterium]
MQECKRVGIHGIGIYLPEPVRKNDWWPSKIVDSWRGKSGASLVRSSNDSDEPISEGGRRTLEGMAEVAADPFKGAVERRAMPDGMVASDMEAAAAKDALSRAGIDPGEAGMLLTNSQLPDFLSVPTAPAVHRKLGLPERCLSTATDAACNSFLTQLAIAEPMIRSGQVRYGLLVQSSGFLHLARPEDQLSASFGRCSDGCGGGARWSRARHLGSGSPHGRQHAQRTGHRLSGRPLVQRAATGALFGRRQVRAAKASLRGPQGKASGG